MDKWLRRIRGAVGIGLAWAAAWFLAGLVLLLIVGLGAADVPFPLGFALLGFIAGIVFSLVLGVVEGDRGFEELSIPRFALWGGVGGAAVGGVLGLVAGLGADAAALAAVLGLAGAGCASGSLALARRAEDRPPLRHGHDSAETLEDGNARDRLGEGR